MSTVKSAEIGGERITQLIASISSSTNVSMLDFFEQQATSYVFALYDIQAIPQEHAKKLAQRILRAKKNRQEEMQRLADQAMTRLASNTYKKWGL